MPLAMQACARLPLSSCMQAHEPQPMATRHLHLWTPPEPGSDQEKAEQAAMQRVDACLADHETIFSV